MAGLGRIGCGRSLGSRLEVSWSVQNSSLEIATGRFPWDRNSRYSALYVYDNTTRFLRWLKVEHDRSSGFSSD